ncbi:MAG: methyltransferase domain-containing protein [Chitinophagales bacterium]|nr:methyltransferase domain-containing protein [Chitinophagales bacterium]
MKKEIEDIEHVASHYLLAAIGKKVLRPGGKELTIELIKSLNINPKDHVVEFAPGQGYSTNMVLENHPASYIGIDLDEDHVNLLKSKIKPIDGTHIEVIIGDAEKTGLADNSTDKIFGEAMLSMHANQRKMRIIKEAARILKPGGLYAIHELELNLAGESEEKQVKIQRDLALVSHVNARPQTIEEWSKLLEDEGFEVIDIQRRPLKVLDPSRIVADEGILQTLKIGYNVLTMPKARKRVLAMRKTFKAHDKNLNAVAILARKK